MELNFKQFKGVLSNGHTYTIKPKLQDGFIVVSRFIYHSISGECLTNDLILEQFTSDEFISKLKKVAHKAKNQWGVELIK